MVWGACAGGDHPGRCGAHLPAPGDVLHPAPQLGVPAARAIVGDGVGGLPPLERSRALTDAARAGLAAFLDD